MALAIRVVPTLHGEVAKKFEAAAKKVETNPGTLDYRKQKLSRSIFKKLSCNFRRKVLQTNDCSVSCRICFPSGAHSLASPNGFYPVYALMYSLYSVCGSQRFLFCLSPYLFSEWHIVPQLYIQIKQSRTRSRKALDEWKASRRLGKQIRGFYGFCLSPPCSSFSSKLILCHKTQKRMPKTLHLAHPPLPILNL